MMLFGNLPRIHRIHQRLGLEGSVDGIATQPTDHLKTVRGPGA
jgi:hypothetical protein